MMLKKTFFLFFFLITGISVFAQGSRFDEFSNKLLFNIFKPEPDSSVRDFLKSYIPSFYPGQAKNNHNQTTNKGVYSPEIHSFLFTQHPYFKSHFSNGELAFYCRRYKEPGAIEVYDVKLSFGFDTQKDADLAFSSLIESYLPISDQHKISSEAGSQTAAFSSNDPKNVLRKIQFRYIADPLNKGHYKILFETTNSL